MRPNTLLCVVLTLLIPAAERGLDACGDKFLPRSGGTRFERPSMRRAPATIVAYAPTGSGLTGSLADIPVRDTLTRAGYTVTVATTRAELELTLTSATVDLVLLDLSEASALSQQLTTTSRPSIVPVVFGRSTDEIKVALRSFAHAVKSPRRHQAYLEAVDDALEVRRRTIATTAAASTR